MDKTTILSVGPLSGDPVRKIKPGVRGVTGAVPDVGTYESTLERDLMELIRFDRDVHEFVAQPLTITFQDRDGARRSYTPDGLIRFKEDARSHRPPILYEVKYREDFRNSWRSLMPKMRAAKAYSEERGWSFQVFTEREIRTEYLRNVRFLWPFVKRVPEASVTKRILNVLNDLDEADTDFLLCALCKDPENRALMIPAIAHLIAIGKIGCDLDKPLTMRSLIWTIGETE